MAENKRSFISTLKYIASIGYIMLITCDKNDESRYERVANADKLTPSQEFVDAMMWVIVKDKVLWGGDLCSAFLENEHDDTFEFGLGVNTAYNGVIDFISCGIRKNNPVIALIRNFFATRNSSTQKIEPFCLMVLKKSLLPLCNEENIDKLYEVVECAKKVIPGEAWGNFSDGFYPYYMALIEEFDLINVLES